MALALLELLEVDLDQVKFRIDTGTNRFYQLKVGRAYRSRSGINWIDQVVYATPITANPASNNWFNSTQEVSLPVTRFENGRAYVQLFSFKNPQGKSPAYSNILRVSLGVDASPPANLVAPFSVEATMNRPMSFEAPRRVAFHPGVTNFAQPASIDNLLGAILNAAGPLVSNLLRNPALGGAAPGNGQPAAPAASSGNASQVDLIGLLLRTVLGSLAGATIPSLSGQSSVSFARTPAGAMPAGNRFATSQSVEYAQPFIFGIDDALIAALAGPILQVLPQLMNSANQNRLQMRQANNALITNVLSEVQRKLLLEKLIEAQRQAPAGAQPAGGIDPTQLLQLLQQAPANSPASSPSPAPAAGLPAGIARPASLSMSVDSRSVLSRTAVVTFIRENELAWNGAKALLFAKNHPLQLKLRLDVSGEAPAKPLPKAILKFTFKDAQQAILAEKTVKQKNVLANSPMSFTFPADELAHFPTDQLITVFAELRWLSSKSQQVYKALGSLDLVLVNAYYLKEQGKTLALEQELTDMQRFRPFWNKIWESNAQANGNGRSGGEKKYLWELDVLARYQVNLSADHTANGFLDTKHLPTTTDPSGVTALSDGRMKGGIELSIAELNKLLPLWPGESPLNAEQLAAINTHSFTSAHASEFVYPLKLKGKAANRGMVWIVPVFKLTEFTLGRVEQVADSGQVISIADTPVRFPLPVSARVLGLKSHA